MALLCADSSDMRGAVATPQKRPLAGIAARLGRRGCVMPPLLLRNAPSRRARRYHRRRRGARGPRASQRQRRRRSRRPRRDAHDATAAVKRLGHSNHWRGRRRGCLAGPVVACACYLPADADAKWNRRPEDDHDGESERSYIRAIKRGAGRALRARQGRRAAIAGAAVHAGVGAGAREPPGRPFPPRASARAWTASRGRARFGRREQRSGGGGPARGRC